jgi:uncharacterized protein involved in outer membrane biogenesis
MTTARQVGRWALYALGGFVALVILVRLGVGIYLGTPAGKAMVARQIGSRIGMPVEVTTVRLGLLTSSISMRVFDPSAAEPAKAEVFAVESANADVSLFGLIRGRVAPTTVELRDVNLTLHVSADGKVLTTLPRAPEGAGEGAPFPVIKLTGGLTVRQDGRPEFSLRGLDVAVQPEGSSVKLSGAIDDPLWAKWTIAGEINRDAKTGWLELTTDDGPLTMDRLGSIPFVPPAVWKRVRPDGRGAAALRLMVGSDREVRYSVDIRPNAAGITFPDAEATLAKVTGLIRVSGAKVDLAGTRGELAGGTITADGGFDFGPEPTTANLRVSAEGLDVRRLPDSWGLPKEFEGKLKGRAELALRIHSDGRVETGGGGEGTIEGARFNGIPVEVEVRLGSDGKRYRFESPRPKAEGQGERGESARPILVTSLRGVTCFRPLRGHHPAPSRADRSFLIAHRIPVAVAAERPKRRDTAERCHEGDCNTLVAPGYVVPPLRSENLPVPKATHIRQTNALPLPPELFILLLNYQDKKPVDPPKKDDPTTLDATLRFRDIEISELLEKTNVKLGYRITGKISAEVSMSVPIASVTSQAAYEFTGTVTSRAIKFEGLTVRDLSAKATYKDGKLTLTELTGKIDQPGTPDAPPGVFRGSATAARSPPGDVTASLTFERIPLGEVLKAIPDLVLDVKGTVSGKGELKVPYEKLEDPKAWGASGELASAELVVEGRRAKGVSVKAEVAKGALSLTEAKANVEGIDVTGEGKLTLSDKYPFAVTVRTTGTDVTDLRKLVPELELPAPVEGVLETESKITGTADPFTFAASGTVKASKLTLAKTLANQVEFKWEVTRERVVLSGLKADVFGGTVTGSADVPVSPEKAGSFEVTFKNVDAAAASEFVPDFPVRVAGKVSGKVAGVVAPAKPGQSRVGNLDVDLTAPKLTVQGVPAERLVGKGTIRGGALEYELEGKTLGGSFELKGRYPGKKKGDVKPADDRGSFRLTGADLSRVATDVGIRSLAPLRGRVDATFTFENDLSAGSGRVVIRGLEWGREAVSRELVGTLVLRDGRLELTDVGGTLAGGTIRARAHVLVTEPRRNFFTLAVEGADAKALFAPVADLTGVMEGRVTVVVRGQLGREMHGSGSLAMPRGEVSGVPVTDLRVPFEWATAPGGYGQFTVRDAAAQAGPGRIQAKVTVDWGVETRVDGLIRFTEVPLRTILPALGESGFFGNGRITGRFDIGGSRVRSVDDLTGTLLATLNQTSVRELPILRQAVPQLNPFGLVKPFEAGDVRATLSRGVFRVHRLALASPQAQLFAEGTITTSGRVDLDVVAHTGAIGPDVGALRAFGLRVPAAGLLPVALIRDVTAFLSNRTVRLTITGTTSNPIVRVNVGALLTEQAVRFFLARYVLPAEVAGGLGLSAGFSSMDRQR